MLTAIHIHAYLGLSILALLSATTTAAPNTVFVVEPDTVYEAKWPDTAVLINLSADTIQLDSIFVLLDTSRYTCCDLWFRVSDGFYGYEVGSLYAPVHFTPLSVFPGGPIYAPGGRALELYPWVYLECGPPMGPWVLLDTIGVTLVFAIDGERDTLVVLREAGITGVGQVAPRTGGGRLPAGCHTTLSGRRTGATHAKTRTTRARSAEVLLDEDGLGGHVDVPGSGGRNE